MDGLTALQEADTGSARQKQSADLRKRRENAMTVIDWIIVASYLIGLIVIGVFAKGKVQTMDDFILGGKRFGRLALIGTIVATMVGSGMTLGAVGTAYSSGSTSTVPWMYFGFATGLIVMGLIAPRVREKGTRSLAEMIHLEYGKTARLCMAAVVTFYAVSMVAINIAGLRTVIVNCFGLPESSIVLATVLAAAIAILYTSLGGMYAVVWTDAVQFLIMFLGVFLFAPFFGLAKAGGAAPLEATMREVGGSFTNPFAAGVTSSMIGMMLSYFLCSPGDPTMPQRALAAKDSKSAKFAFLVSGGIGYWMGIALIIIGCAVRVLMPGIENSNSVLPQFIIHYFPPVLRGLVIAGITAAVMSSFDSFLILGTTHVMYDIGRVINPEIKDRTIQKSLPRITIIMGAVGIIIALYISSLFDYLYMVFSTTGPATCPAMFAALFFRKKTSSFGVVASIIAGFLVPAVLYMTVGYNVFLGDPIFFGLFASIAALVLGSVLVKDKRTPEEFEAEARAGADK